MFAVMSNKFLNRFILAFPFTIGVLLWIILSFKCAILFYGIVNLGMYMHLTITTLTNAFIGREINTKGDVFWKTLFLTIGCVCLAIFFN